MHMLAIAKVGTFFYIDECSALGKEVIYTGTAEVLGYAANDWGCGFWQMLCQTII
jgi:hypothetical protein